MDISWGCCENLAFQVAPQEKSQGVRSGDLGSHSTWWYILYNAITRSPKSSAKRCPDSKKSVWRGSILYPPHPSKSSTSLSWEYLIHLWYHKVIDDRAKYACPLMLPSKKNGANNDPLSQSPIQTFNFSLLMFQS